MVADNPNRPPPRYPPGRHKWTYQTLHAIISGWFKYEERWLTCEQAYDTPDEAGAAAGAWLAAGARSGTLVRVRLTRVY